MTRRTHWLRIAGTIGALFAVLCVGALYTLQSSWFQEQVGRQVIARLERATGTRVNVKSLTFDWRNRTIEFRSVVMRGSEPPNAAPLFSADDVTLAFKLSSLLEPKVDLQSVRIQRPEIYLIVRSDGSTNLPSTQHSAVQRLFDLRVHRFLVEDGGLTVNFRHIPLQFSGSDMQARCRYDTKHAAYDLQFSSKETSTGQSAARLAMNVGGRIRIEKNRIVVQNLHVAKGNSTLAARGSIENFANPMADFQLSAHVQAVDAKRYFSRDAWNSGEATLTGSAHYDTTGGVTFHGNVAGRKLSYRTASVDLSGIDLDSELSGSPDHVQFTRFVLRVLGATLTGKAELADLTKLDLDGSVTRLDLNRLASKLFLRSLPWTALGEGRIRFSSNFANQVPQDSLAARLTLQPAYGSAPVSGFLDFTYRTPSRLLEFNPSHLNLAGTQLSFSGLPSANMQVVLDSTNLIGLGSALAVLHTLPIPALPVIERNGSAHFDGTVARLLTAPQIVGHVALSNFRLADKHWDTLRAEINLSPQMADFTSFTLASGLSRVSGSGRVDLANWIPAANGHVQINGHFQRIDLTQSAFQMPIVPMLPKFFSGGIASGSVAISGPFSNPVGRVQLHIKDADLNGARMDQIQMNASLESNRVRLTGGRVQSGSAVLLFSGAFAHPDASWKDGQLSIKLDSNGFPLAGVPEWRRLEPAINGTAEIHGEGAVRIASGELEPATANGILKVRNLAYNGETFGALTVNAATSNNVLTTKLAGDLRGHSFSGNAEIQLVGKSPMNAEVHFDRLDLTALRAIVYPTQNGGLPFQGIVSGGLSIGGPLLRPRSWRSKLDLKEVEITPKLPQPTPHNVSALTLHNVAPVVVDAVSGVATINSLQLSGDNTALTVQGSLHYASQPALDLRMNGSVNLQILQLFDPSLQSSGSAMIAASLQGTIAKPAVTGTIDIAQGTVFTANLPNGLSNVNGRIVFNRDRATIQNLNAQVGGGDLSLAGFIGLSSTGPLVYHVQASAANVRLRYGGGISVTANADLRLTGSSQSSILSGTATVSRVVLNPNTDVGNLLAAFGAAAAAPANSNEFVSGLHLDLAVESAPNLQLSTALSRDVEAEIDVRLRGTPDHPVLLGSISANQGDIKVFGSKYSINHGEVRFQNTARIEPVLDLDLQTQTRGITVNITISGTIDKLNIAYRSDPPLQPRDIIALLTVGRAPNSSSNVQMSHNPGDLSTAQGASTVLGQAISSPPNRLSKLFGITNVKIDPMVQGIITNTPQARLTLEQQVSRDLTVTYVTNLSQTSEQIFRVEWALNPQYSLVALRDENGEFGIDIQYKKRFR